MDLPQILQALQSSEHSAFETAVSVLKNFEKPLSEKEFALLKKFQEERKAEADAGMKLSEIPDEMLRLSHRPKTLLHPLLVSQCVLTLSKLSYMDVNRQKLLQRDVLPHALLRFSLSSKEAAPLLAAALQLPLQQLQSSLNCAISLLRCIAVSIFSKDLLGTICGSFAIPRVKQATVLEHTAIQAVAPKLKEISSTDAQKLWWNLLAHVLHAQAVQYAKNTKHNLKNTADPSALHNAVDYAARSQRFAFASGSREVKQLAQLAYQCYSAAPEEFSAVHSLLEAKEVILLATLHTHLKDKSAAPFAVSSAALLQTIKAFPSFLSRLFYCSNSAGLHAAQNALCIAKDSSVEDFLEMCLYNIGLTNTTSEMFFDYLTILISVSSSVNKKKTGECLRDVLVSKGGSDFMESLLTPIVNNPRVITAAVVYRMAPLYSQVIRLLVEVSADDNWRRTVTAAVVQGSLAFLTTRCRTSMEKSLVSHIIVSLVDALRRVDQASMKSLISDAVRESEENLIRFLQRELSSPAAESVTLALRLIHSLGLKKGHSGISEGFSAALRNAKKEDSIRRALLLYTPHNKENGKAEDASVELTSLIREALIQPLLDECVEVEVVRPDAFLALGFLLQDPSSQSSKEALVPLLSSADVLKSLLLPEGDSPSSPTSPSSPSFTRWATEGGEAELVGTASEVLRIAEGLSTEGFHAPLVKLLTHPSRWLQQRVHQYMTERLANTPDDKKRPLLLALWKSLMQSVFGLKDDTASISAESLPPILSSQATGAIHLIARFMLIQLNASSSPQDFLKSGDTTVFLAELLFALGHDYVQGRDPAFFGLTEFVKGKPRSEIQGVQVGPLAEVLGKQYSSVLSQSPMSTIHVLQRLLDWMTQAVAPPFLVSAASRGVVLLLSFLSQIHRNGKLASDVNLGLGLEIPEEEEGIPFPLVPSSSSLFISKCFSLVFSRLRSALGQLIFMEKKDLALASDSAELIHDFVEEDLTARRLIKVYPDRPPKGMSQDDFDDMKKKDRIALSNAKDQLDAELNKRRDQVLTKTRAFLGPFMTVRLFGVTPQVDLSSVAVFYPYFLHLLCGGADPLHIPPPPASEKETERSPTISPFLSSLYLDCVRGLLLHTAFGPYSEVLTSAVVRLSTQKFLEKDDVSQLSALALAMRRRMTQMLPPPLFVILTPFCRVAFKAGRGSAALTTTIPIATQHQLLGLLLQSVGQPHIPQPTQAMNLFAFLLCNFPSHYKSVLQGVLSLMPLIPAKHLATIEEGMFLRGDGFRDVTASCLSRFSHFQTTRRAIVLAAIFVTEDSSPLISNTVLKGVKEVAADERYEFEVQSSDWEHLLYFLQKYGNEKQRALLIALTMKKLFLMPSSNESTHETWVSDICQVGGLASIVALSSLSSALHPKAAVLAVEYLCTINEKVEDSAELLLRETLHAGRIVLNDMCLDTLREIAPGLQTRLARPPKEASATHKEQYLASSTVWLTIVSCRLEETELLQNIIEQQSRTLNNSQSLMVHRSVCDSMMELTKKEEVRKMQQLDDFVSKCLKQTIHSGSYVKKKAHAWGLGGVISGLGLPGLRRYQIMETIRTAASEKQNEKTGAMILFEVLCEILARRFEPYALSMSESLLEAVADSDSHVAACADDAVQMMMSKCLSGVGLRQLIPHLIEILSCDQAKRRVAPLNFIGHVASCSPKQLAATLPAVMKHIVPCLFEVNNMVSGAAYNALRRVAGVVSNPEIQEQVENILRAMRSPSTELENALDALLYTRFVNQVDPASLALVVPLVSRGLTSSLKQARSKAAQIIATMVTLVRDKKSLLPYADQLIVELENVAQDPEPEARTTSAKAIAAICCAIGAPLVDRVAQWCFEVLEKPSSGTIEKAGGGQVFVELVNSWGLNLMSENAERVEKGMTDHRSGVREGFLYIMVYAPSSLDQGFFQDFLPSSFPWVLDGLSHISDRVREVALTAGESIISLYGTRNLNLIMGPLLNGMYSEVSSLRHSSLILASKLLLHLAAHIRKKTRMQNALLEHQQAKQQALEDAAAGDEETVPEDAGEDGVLTIETARDAEKRGVSLLSAMEEMLGTENFTRLFSAIFTGCHVHVLTVRNECNQAWQVCVASIRAAVKKIFDSLMLLLIHLGSSDNVDCVEAAEKTLEFTTSRLQETIDLCIQFFCDRYKEGDTSDEDDDEEEEEEEEEEKKKPLTEEEKRRIKNKRGCLTCLSAVIALADSKKLISMGGQLVGCILPGMQHADTDVQSAARELFSKVTKEVGPRLIEDAVEAQLHTSIRGVVEVVKVRPQSALQIIFRHFNATKEYTDHDLELLNEVLYIEEAIEDLHTPEYIQSMVKMLLCCLQQGIEDASEVLQVVVVMMDEEESEAIAQHLLKASQVPATRRAALLGMEAFALGTTVDDVEGIINAFQLAVSALSDEDEVNRGHAVRIIPNLINDLEKRIMETLDPDDAKDMTVSKRTSGRYLSQYLDVFHTALATTARSFLQGGVETHFMVLGDGDPKLFDALLGFCQRGLDYGTPEQKIEAVECIQDLMVFAPPSVSANAANTVAGRCSKALFTRNEGNVVLALVKLCLSLLQFPANGKEKMVEGTMALALFNATLCDSGEARVVALQVVIQLLQRSEKYAELILGNVMTKKSAVDTPLYRTVLCRFVSVIMRYSHFTKAFMQIPKLMALIRPIWEGSATPAQAAAGGVAVGSLCMSASVTDDQLQEIKELILRMVSSPGSASLAGYAAVFSLILSAGERTDKNFLEVSAEALASAAKFGSTSKLSTLWVLRAAAAVATTGFISESKFQPENYYPLMRRILPTDECLMSTAQYFYECVSKAYPGTAEAMEGFPRGFSTSCMNGFDADLDDELVADSLA